MECNIDQLSIENHFVNNKWNYNIPNKLLLTIIYLDVEFTSKKQIALVCNKKKTSFNYKNKCNLFTYLDFVKIFAFRSTNYEFVIIYYQKQQQLQ